MSDFLGKAVFLSKRPYYTQNISLHVDRPFTAKTIYVKNELKTEANHLYLLFVQEVDIPFNIVTTIKKMGNYSLDSLLCNSESGSVRNCNAKILQTVGQSDSSKQFTATAQQDSAIHLLIKCIC